MQAILNNNFLLGTLLAKDLPQKERLLVGLAAGQMPRSNPIGAVLLKPIIDARVEAERKSAAADTSSSTLQRPVEIELPAESATARLRIEGVPGSSWSLRDAPQGVEIHAEGEYARLTFRDQTQTSVVAIVDGIERRFRVRRGPAPSGNGAGGGGGISRANVEALLAALNQLAGSREGAGQAGTGGWEQSGESPAAQRPAAAAGRGGYGSSREFPGAEQTSASQSGAAAKDQPLGAEGGGEPAPAGSAKARQRG
jgi:hypothetical protein